MTAAVILTNDRLGYASILILMSPAFAAEFCIQRIVKARGAFHSLAKA